MRAEAVVVGECGAEAGGGDAELGGGGDDVAPGVLRVGDGGGEVVRGEQGGQIRLRGIGRPDVVEKLGADDAAAAPDLGKPGEVDILAVLRGTCLHLVEPLGVGDDLGRVQAVFDISGESFGRGPGERCAGGTWEAAACDAQLGVSRQRAGEHCFSDAGDRDAEVEPGLDGPASGAFLFGLVEDDVDERLSGRLVRAARRTRR